MEDITLGTNFSSVQTQITLEKTLVWNDIEYSAKTISSRTHPATLKHSDIFHARSQKVLKSPSHWKAVGELKNIQMSLGFATTKELVS